jgi:ketosteroid isomerase-like protein
MFRAIDSCDWDQLPAFFHDDVVYDRPGYRQFKGIDDLLRFYREERPVESGQHELETVLVKGNHAVAIGTFRGEMRDGRAEDVMFADAYTYKNGRIWHRRTYFFRPAI